MWLLRRGPPLLPEIPSRVSRDHRSLTALRQSLLRGKMGGGEVERRNLSRNPQISQQKEVAGEAGLGILGSTLFQF